MTLAQRARPEAAGPGGPVLAPRKEFALDGFRFGSGSRVKQVWSLTKFFSVCPSQSRISVK